MYLTQGLHRALQRHPEKIALCHLAPDGERRWSFARQGRFIRLGAVGVERQMEAFEQHLAIRRGRGENEFHGEGCAS